mgnify:CR=1 FL=1
MNKLSIVIPVYNGEKYIDRCLEIIEVCEVPRDRTRFGKVPVCADVAKESGIVLIGVDAGVNGDRIPELAWSL